MTGRSFVYVALLAALAVSSGATPAAAAAPESQTGATETPAGSHEPMTVLGMQVFIDRETGEMRAPTPAEAAELSSQLQQMFAAPATREAAIVEHADGMLSAEVDFSMMDFSVVRVGTDGTPVFDCIGGAREAAALTETPAPTTLGPEEE